MLVPESFGWLNFCHLRHLEEVVVVVQEKVESLKRKELRKFRDWSYLDPQVVF